MADNTHPHPSADDPLSRLRAALDHAAHLLPAQGPIGVFIHHNTLHALEHLPFDRAVRQAARVFGCEPYLPEARYRAERATGRIPDADLRAVLADDLGDGGPEPVAGAGTRFDLRFAMLAHPQASGTPDEVRWKLADEQIPTRHAELWGRCEQAVRAVPPPPPPPPPARHRDRLLAATAVDPDLPANDLLTRYTAAFLDQGVAHHPLPHKSVGFFRGFCELYARTTAVERWQNRLGPLCAQALQQNTPPLESVRDSLADLGVPAAEWDEFLSATVLALRGWGGMVRQVEQRADSVHHPIPAGTFVEFVAVRLLLDRAAAGQVAADELGYTGPLSRLRAFLVSPTRQREADYPDPSLAHRADVQRAYAVFQAATAVGVTDVTPEFVREVEAFDEVERRRVFHLAYERRVRVRTLDAVAHRAAHPLPAVAPRFQVVTCLDEREESFRRHLEEMAPDCETFGAAGFFAVPMYYRGAADAHFVPLCPIVLTPKHWVTERVDEHAAGDHERKAGLRARLGRLAHRLHLGTRTPVVGSLLAAAGALASVPLVARILFPRLTARIRGTAGKAVRPPPHTTLALERTADTPGDHNGLLGFSVDEMAGMGERLLRDIGLTSGFAPLVFILGHGSNSLNNPHKSAYDCGACGGSPGAPNGRAAAHLLNDPRVRVRLADRGIRIPAGTWFVGGHHNTCDDSVTVFDAERIPPERVAEFRRVRAEVQQACDRNAHERSRRFESCPLTSTAADAHKHVEARSEDLAQARPELGHATNAVCVVGRRARTRGLFFDRRAFLTSYDPTQDTPDAAVLARTLAAVFPVCGGISLEYLFSHTDPAGYGCGTKLPHNITALLGVMDGAASDLRTGLPWQMTEIHEPVRLLVVVETTAEVFARLMAADPAVGGMTRNGWVQVALLHPDTGRLSVFDRGGFRPHAPGPDPLRRVRGSAEWYAGKRGHLEFVDTTAGGAA